MFSSGAAWDKGWRTFPEAAEALQLVYLFVGLHGAAVAPSHAAQVHLGLESNLHHVSGLRKGHGHGTRGAAGQDADQNARVCRWGGDSTADAFRQIRNSDSSKALECTLVISDFFFFYHTVSQLPFVFILSPSPLKSST